MEKLKPYLTFSFPPPGATSLLFKRGAERNAERMRQKTVEEHREAMLPLPEVRVPPTEKLAVPLTCGGVPCEWISHVDSPEDKAVLYIHGGSWAYGNLETARVVGMLLCDVTGYRVLVMEYRLAPEHPFPAAAEDCLSVYQWMLREGFAPENIALFGDSAGGNLSLSLIHQLKGLSLPLPAAVALASPATDLTENSELFRSKPDLLFTRYNGREQNVFSLYYADHNREDPLISPIYGDLTGFPPLLIHVGQDEGLCVDNDLFAQAAYDAGVDVSLKIWREMFHDFSVVGVALKESRQSMEEFGEFIVSHLEQVPEWE